MTKPNKPMRIFLFSLLCLPSVWAADLKTYQETYRKNSEQILQSFQPKFDALQQQHQKSLEAFKTTAQNQGDLTKTKAAVTEIERFKKAKSLPATLDDAEISAIKTFQAAYVKEYTKQEADMTAKLCELATRYEQALDRLQKELVKTLKLDEATAVQAEKEKAQASIKGYTDQLATLSGPAAAGATGVDTGKATRTANGASSASRTSALAPWDNHVNLEHPYLVIDFARGDKMQKFPMYSLAAVPKGGWTDEYKTIKLVLKKIEPGTFVMGSPVNELERSYYETQHEVTLTQPFYIGVFELTQKQWERVTGSWPPCYFSNRKCRDERPVEQVSYYDIRARGPAERSRSLEEWPATNLVQRTSFMGRLQAKTGMAFDLPTEAQWEYACRAGTTEALNSGKPITATESCPNLSPLGRYRYNGGVIDGNFWPSEQSPTENGTAKVGRYLPNAWGLYDMHGNALEWCLDWHAEYLGKETDPKGASSGSRRVLRGGCWLNEPQYCRAAMRHCFPPEEHSYYMGLRIALTLDKP